jgi:predicted LPLAT superfamily acyltransferase
LYIKQAKPTKKTTMAVRRKLTVHERKTIKQVLEHGNPELNAKVTDIMRRKTVQRAFRDALDNIGFGEVQLAQNLIDLTNAEETKHFAFQGKVEDERNVAALGIRLAANKALASYIGLDVKHIEVDDNSTFTPIVDQIAKLSDTELDAVLQETYSLIEGDGTSADGEEGTS